MQQNVLNRWIVLSPDIQFSAVRNNKPHEGLCLLPAPCGILLLLLDAKDGGDIFLQKSFDFQQTPWNFIQENANL
jgi:hypothetical protein